MSLRPLFNDFLFFITTRMYFHCLTYFPIIKDLAIILNDDLHGPAMCMCSLAFQDDTCNTTPRALYKCQEVFGKLCC